MPSLRTVRPYPKRDRMIGFLYLGTIVPQQLESQILVVRNVEIRIELLVLIDGGQLHGGVKIFCFGNGPKEEETVNRWCAKYPNTISFIGRTKFDGELRFISHLDAMVSMDSANMHMASLVGTPAVSIWGATSPLAGFLGWNQKREDCIELDLECRPCSIFGNKPCIHGDYRCMKIEPEHVAERILKKLRK